MEEQGQQDLEERAAALRAPIGQTLVPPLILTYAPPPVGALPPFSLTTDLTLVAMRWQSMVERL